MRIRRLTGVALMDDFQIKFRKVIAIGFRTNKFKLAIHIEKKKTARNVDTHWPTG